MLLKASNTTRENSRNGLLFAAAAAAAVIGISGQYIGHLLSRDKLSSAAMTHSSPSPSVSVNCRYTAPAGIGRSVFTARC